MMLAGFLIFYRRIIEWQRCLTRRLDNYIIEANYGEKEGFDVGIHE